MAARVIRVLAFFDERKRSLSVGEIAPEHNWPHSSTSALLGDWVQNDSLKDGQLLRPMQHISDMTGEVTILAAQNGVHSQYLRIVEGTHPLPLQLNIGLLRPLFGSGTNRMLLAQMDDTSIGLIDNEHTRAEAMRAGINRFLAA